MSLIAPNAQETFLQPSDLFSGFINLRAAAVVAFRYSRIHAALDAFTKGDDSDDLRRRRWRIGLYREVVSLPSTLPYSPHKLIPAKREFKRAIGDLMTSGCTGGSFFSRTHFRWLDVDNSDQFVIIWDLISPLPAPLPFATWIANQLPPEVANENKWWTFSSAISRVDVTRPNWWDASESDLRVCYLLRLICILC